MSAELESTVRTPAEQLADCRALLEAVRAAAPRIAEARELPADIVAALKAAGAFRMLIPARFGGGEVPFEDYVYLIQDLAHADASTAWCVNQAAVIATTSLWLEAPQLEAMWSDPLAAVANGPPFKCLLSPAEGGFSLTGHWGFSSGCQHATWMGCAAPFSEGGYRSAFVRPDQVTFDDNWQVAGLRGTGSFEFHTEGLIVPAEQVANLLGEPAVVSVVTRIPGTLMFAVSFACVALGVARAAIDDVVEVAQGKVPRFAGTKVADDPDMQRFIGKAVARWRAADAYLHATVEDVVAAVRARLAITHDERARLRMAGTHVIRECAEVVDLAYKVSGSTGIYQTHDLQRRFQDMHVITQHVQGRESYFGLLGRYEITGEYEIGPMT